MDEKDRDICPEGVKEWKCPYMEYDDNWRALDTERYHCEKCGRSYKLYEEEMR